MLIYAVIAVAGLALLAASAWVLAPQFLEQPDYTVAERDGAIQIRDYPAMIVAEVVRRGPRDGAIRKGFGPLASYIFARERAGESISMTVPVAQRPDKDGDAWRVQFVMPRRYTLDTLPVPASDDVRLREVPAQRRAAIRFGGVATDGLLAEKEAALRGWLRGRGLDATGAPLYAYYNDPSTPGVFRRNEVLIDLP